MHQIYSRITVVAVLAFCCVNISSQPRPEDVGSPDSNLPNNVAVVTYASDFSQMKKVRALVNSIRDFGKEYNNCPVYVVLDDTAKYPIDKLHSENVRLLFTDMDPTFRNYPYVIKAFAAAQVEDLVKNDIKTLIWIDPEYLVLNTFEDYILDKDCDVVLRPVSLDNNIGIKPGSEPGEYWSRVLELVELDYNTLPIVTTAVDEVDVRSYLNCQVFSWNPGLGIAEKWAGLMPELIRDRDYQDSACRESSKKIFLHQVVFTAVINSMVQPQRIRDLPLRSNYPLNLHDQLSEKKQVNQLNDIYLLSYDELWQYNPDWMERLPAREPLKTWLEDAYTGFLEITDNLYRMEGESNSYLITSAEGSVLIDPTGAMAAPRYFRKLIEKYPLKAILITHGHHDHMMNISDWKTNDQIEVIAQREYVNYLGYQDMLARYYARRNSIWQGIPFDEDTVIMADTPVETTILFIDNYEFELGGIHFKMTHTPGETPDVMTIWVPELGAVFVGDNYYEFFPNIYTLRGTPTRPATGYIAAMDLALSYEPEYFCMGHREPLIGKNNIQATVTNFRDVLQYVHDETVKGLNEGKDVYTLMDEIDYPEHCAPIAEYFGKVDWAVRGIYEGYIGWFDGNPSHMYATPVSAIFPDLADLGGGPDEIVALAEKHYQNGEYVKVLHLTEVALAADPEHKASWEIRLKAMQGLWQGPYNYIERIFLRNGAKIAREKLAGE